jgi:hypothetical protein
MASVYMLGGDA